MAGHSWLHLVLLTVTVAVFVVLMTISALAGSGKGFFNNSTGDVSDLFEVCITPAGWTFSIWGIIYAWLAAGLVYVVSLVFRSRDEGPAYRNPPVPSRPFFFCYSVNLVMNGIWLLQWDRQNMVAAAVLLLLIAISNWVTLGISCVNVYEHLSYLKQKAHLDLVLVRAVLQNGLGVYTTWTTIASILNLVIVLTFKAELSGDTPCYIGLSLLTVIIVLWFILENTVLDGYVRYILTQYPVLVMALSGIYDKKHVTESTGVVVFIGVLLGLVTFLLVSRVVLVVVRHKRKPLDNEVPITKVMDIAGYDSTLK